MSARNDGLLNTGLSSAAARRVAAKIEAENKKKAAERAQLMPTAQWMVDLIEEEKKKVVDLTKIVINISNENLYRDQMLARKLHLEWLDGVKNRINNVFRERPKQEKEEDGEGENE